MSSKKRKRTDQDDIIKRINSTSFSDFLGKHFAPIDSPFARDQPGKAEERFDCSLYMTKKAKYVTDGKHRLNDDVLEQCLALVEHTSRPDYEASSIGWHIQRKRREMMDKDMRYLIVRRTGANADADIEGFLSCMFTHEAGKLVIYIYEIHLRDSVRGCGLGKHLMLLAHKMGASVGVDQSMLTVFRSNVRTLKWYFGLGYAIDESSPPAKVLRGDKTKESDYLILSKALPDK